MTTMLPSREYHQQMLDLQPAVPLEELDSMLTQRVIDVESLRAQGLDATEGQYQAHELLQKIGNTKINDKPKWDVYRQHDEHLQLQDRLQRKLDIPTYRKWIAAFASQARQIPDKQTPEAQNAAAAEACLQQLAIKQEWPVDKQVHEYARLQEYIAGTETTAKNEAPRRRRILALAAAGIALAAVTVGAVTFASNRGSSHTNAKITIGTTTVSANQFPRSTVPTTTPSAPKTTTPPASHTPKPPVKPTPKPPVAPAPTHPQLKNPVVAAHHEKLSRTGDTIWTHAQRLLGKSATAKQVKSFTRSILIANHKSGYQARHLRRGYEFEIPATHF